MGNIGGSIEMNLAEELARGAADMDGMGQWLDGLSDDERAAQVLSLGKKAQRTLWALTADRPATLEDLVPSTTKPLTPIRHFGRNSLPFFSRFEKRFCRSEQDANVLLGYNEGPTRALIGPGYFVTRVSDLPDRGQIVIDYTMRPESKAKDWPDIQDNESGLGRVVYGFMHDYLRKVSTHVTIGKAWKHGKETENYFVLLREPGVDKPA